MRWTRPRVWILASSKISLGEMRDYCEFHDAKDYFYKQFGSEMHPHFAAPQGASLVMVAGKRCYSALNKANNPNLVKVREDAAEYIDNILKQGHGSVLEHASYTFGIENCSRVFTGEMNRHRAGWAISEMSMRYVRFTDLPLVETPILRKKLYSSIPGNDVTPEHEEISAHNDLVEKTRACFARVAKVVEKEYINLQDLWGHLLSESSKFKDKKAVTSMMRRIIPMGVSTGGIWTGNLRAIRHVLTMRADPAAEEEINEIAVMLLQLMMMYEPTIFKDFELGEGGWKPKYVGV